MTFVLRVICSALLFGSICADKKEQKSHQQIIKAEFPLPVNNGVMGVASMAGVTSRNGRVSSIGGIQFYPFGHKPLAQKGLETSKLKIENQINNHPKNTWNIEGLINVHPETVASSSIRIGNAGSNVEIWRNGMEPILWPMGSVTPMNVIDYQRNMDMIHREMFNNFVPPDLKYLKRTWFYPTFNPFLN